MSTKKENSSIDQILSRIYGGSRGWAFSRKDFALLGNADLIDKSLSILAKKGTIRRVMRGLYDYPRYSKWLQQSLEPDIDQVAHALARKYGWNIQVTGNAALNIMGLSTQVPTRYLYLSDGSSKTYLIGTVELEFKKARYSLLNTKRQDSALLVQALDSLGSANVGQAELHVFARYLTPDKPLPAKTRNAIARDTQYVTSWIQQAIMQILELASSEGTV